jgi:regulator of nonsense transcripts 3
MTKSVPMAATANATAQAPTSANNETGHGSGGANTIPRKIVIRRLPPTLTKEQFMEVVSPLAEHDYFCYCGADMK